MHVPFPCSFTVTMPEYVADGNVCMLGVLVRVYNRTRGQGDAEAEQQEASIEQFEARNSIHAK